MKQVLATPLLKHVDDSGWENVPDQPPYLLAINHVNYLDAPTIAACLLRHKNIQPFFLTKMPVVKMFGPLSRSYLSMIPVDPANRKKSVDLALARLHEGKVIGIFPEGTRNGDTKHLLKAKTGLARLALLSGAPVIPVGIIGPTNLSALQSLKIALFGPERQRITFGPALRFAKMPLEQITKEQLVATSRQIMNAIGALCEKTYDF